MLWEENGYRAEKFIKEFSTQKNWSLFVVFKRLVNKIDQTKFAVLETSSF